MIKLFLGLATLALACAAPAMAQPAAAAPQQARVAIGNLDLTAEPDARLMLARIDRAAVELCGGPGDIAHQRQLRWIRRCREEAVDGAVARLGAPTVVALHARRSGR